MASQIRRHLNPLERWGFSMFPRLVSNSWAQAICPSCLPKCSSKKGVCHHAQPEQLLFLRCWPSDPKSPAVLSADCDCMCQGEGHVCFPFHHDCQFPEASLAMLNWTQNNLHERIETTRRIRGAGI
ncbi:uncharacterized protein isoform X4 [Macaca fascicularis]|uniref:uncharacterized protein isoform X4 n=1 Tax=Macaca fascicularis TaxID=9541 RepID=UPI0032B06AAB